jgi:DNA-3-methyladenine glycosylase
VTGSEPAPVVERSQLYGAAVDVAPRLLDGVIVSTLGGAAVAVRLTEVEAYAGTNDPASHAYRGRTARTAVMFGRPGHLYVYFTYGMHWCANVVCGDDDPDGAAAVLLRAGEVVDGVAAARARRPAARADRDLARGPARLASCLGLDRYADGLDLCSPRSAVRLACLPFPPAAAVRRGPRVGISVATEEPWRFWLDGEVTVSNFRAGGRLRRAGGDRQTGAR